MRSPRGRYPCQEPAHQMTTSLPNQKENTHQSLEIFTCAVCAPKNWTYGSALSRSGPIRPHASGRRWISNSCCCSARCCAGGTCAAGAWACVMSYGGGPRRGEDERGDAGGGLTNLSRLVDVARGENGQEGGGHGSWIGVLVARAGLGEQHAYLWFMPFDSL